MVIVGLTAVAQTVLVSAHFSATTLNSTVGADAAMVRLFVSSSLSPDDLGARGLTPDRLADLDARLAYLVGPGQILRVEVRLPDGTVLAADEPRRAGRRGAALGGFRDRALRSDGHGRHRRGRPERGGRWPPCRRATSCASTSRSSLDGEVRAVVGVWRDAAPIIATLESVRRNVVLVTLSAGLIAAVVLFLVFRSAQGRITRQTRALLDALDHDALTGTAQSRGAGRRVATAIERGRVDQCRRSASRWSTSTTSGCSTRRTATPPATQALLTVVDMLGRTLPADVGVRPLRAGRVPGRRARPARSTR